MYFFQIYLFRKYFVPLKIFFEGKCHAEAMGKLRSFQITLDSSQDVYFAGQTISGKLLVELDAEMHMRGNHVT